MTDFIADDSELNTLYKVLQTDIDHARNDLRQSIPGHPAEQFMAGRMFGLEQSLNHVEKLLNWIKITKKILIKVL